MWGFDIKMLRSFGVYSVLFYFDSTSGVVECWLVVRRSHEESSPTDFL
jgi:hypothetical protein